MSQHDTIRCDDVALIAAVVMDHFDVSDDDFYSSVRTAEVALARQVTMYLARTTTLLSYPEIGAALDRDHSTVMHGAHLVADRIVSDRDLAAKVADVRRELARLLILGAIEAGTLVRDDLTPLTHQEADALRFAVLGETP